MTEHEPLSSKTTWETISAAYAELGRVPEHRPLPAHACSCGEEFAGDEGLARHLRDSADAQH
jgi:hypothetical protein